MISTPRRVIPKNTTKNTILTLPAARTPGEVSSNFSWRMNLCVCMCAEHHSVRDLPVISQHPGQMTKALSTKSKQVGLSAALPCGPDVRH